MIIIVIIEMLTVFFSSFYVVTLLNFLILEIFSFIHFSFLKNPVQSAICNNVNYYRFDPWVDPICHNVNYDSTF